MAHQKRTRAKHTSVRSILEPEELKFCQTFIAFGLRDASEAYRRAFLRKNSRGVWVHAPKGVDLTRDEINAAPPALSHEVAVLANRLLKTAHIAQAIAELQGSPSEHARQVLADNLLFGTSSEKKDAAEQWADLMCEIGADVVVPLGIVKRSVRCSHCRETSDVEIDLTIEVPLSEFFRTREAQRPEAQLPGSGRAPRVPDPWAGSKDKAPGKSGRPVGRPKSKREAVGVPEGSAPA